MASKQNNTKSESDHDMDSLDSLWDDIQLTPVKTSVTTDSALPKDSETITEKIAHNAHIKEACQNVTRAFRELDDSFMYLGVLKKMSLPESNRFFEEKFSILLKLFEMVWENKTYPEKELVFAMAGEDYSILNKLIHAGDATQPIYDGLKSVYGNVEQFKDSGMSIGDSMDALKTLFANRKQDE